MIKTLTLNNGIEMPIFGLGTWLSVKNQAKEAIISAVECGYRLIDNAHVYQNEEEIGEALKYLFENNIVKREDLFIVTKLWNSHHDPEHSFERCQKTLEKLQLDYVDLYLVHWPVGYKYDGDNLTPVKEDGTRNFHDYGLEKVWAGMEKIYENNLAKSIGVSNFNISQIDLVFGSARIKPAVNQIEVGPSFPNIELIRHCQEMGVQIMSYSPLGNPGNSSKNVEKNILEYDHIKNLAQKYNKTPAQICIRFCLDLKTNCIPKSVTKERIKSNMEVFDFSLTKEEIDEIIEKSPNFRTCNPKELMGGSKEFPFFD